MIKNYKYPIWRLFFPLLFVGYLGVTIYYVHIHIENHTVYVHTHPYEKDEPIEHSHSEKNMVALDLIAHTPFSENVVLSYNFTVIQPLLISYRQPLFVTVLYIDSYKNVLLRAPPALCVFTV